MSLSMRDRSSTRRLHKGAGRIGLKLRLPREKSSTPEAKSLFHQDCARSDGAHQVFFVANYEHGLAGERVDRVADHDLQSQTLGIMSCLGGRLHK